MTLYEGTLKTLSGGAHQTNAFNANEDWVRLEFVTIGDQRIRDVRMLNFHYELLKGELGRDVSLSLFTGGFQGPRTDQWTLVAARLADGSVEKIPDTYSRISVQGGFQMMLVTLLLIGAAAAGYVFKIQWLMLGAAALAAFIFLSALRYRGQAASKRGQIRAAMSALDGKKRG